MMPHAMKKTRSRQRGATGGRRSIRSGCLNKWASRAPTCSALSQRGREHQEPHPQAELFFTSGGRNRTTPVDPTGSLS
eukprot:5778166-Pyramimonas_sp.AAC.1